MTSSNSTWQFSGLNPLSHFRYSIIHSLSYSCTQAEGSEAKPNRKGSVSIKSSWLPTGDINSLPLNDGIIVTWVNIGSGNGLVLTGTKTLPKLILIHSLWIMWNTWVYLSAFFGEILLIFIIKLYLKLMLPINCRPEINLLWPGDAYIISLLQGGVSKTLMSS